MVPIGDHQIALLEPCLLCWPSFDHIRDKAPWGEGRPAAVATSGVTSRTLTPSQARSTLPLAISALRQTWP